MSQDSPSATDILSLKLRLRPDIRVRHRSAGQREEYLLENPIQGKFYRLGLSEYALASQLDGTRSLEASLAAANRRLGSEAFTEQEAIAVCGWLVECDLVNGGDRLQGEKLAATFQRANRKPPASWGKLLTMRTSLGNPDRVATLGNDLLGWLVSPVGSIVFVALLVAACVRCIQRSDAIVRIANEVLVFGNGLSFIAICLALKAVHELAHMVACKRFHGHVREFGITWILGFPLPFVDVSSA
jgi:putative peptide zinc metalloprotease protein